MRTDKINIKDKLPTYHAPTGIWNKIEEQLDILDQEQVSKSTSKKLPIYQAPDIFKNIAPQPKKRIISFTAVRVAASVILIIGLSIGFKQFRNRVNTQITHTIEASENNISRMDESLAFDSDFMAVLGEKCKTSPKVCEKSEYEELFAQLKEIEHEEEQLKEALKQFKSPEIESHLVRITNDKIKLENYILKLFS